VFRRAAAPAEAGASIFGPLVGEQEVVQVAKPALTPVAKQVGKQIGE